VKECGRKTICKISTEKKKKMKTIKKKKKKKNKQG